MSNERPRRPACRHLLHITSTLTTCTTQHLIYRVLSPKRGPPRFTQHCGPRPHVLGAPGSVLVPATRPHSYRGPARAAAPPCASGLACLQPDAHCQAQDPAAECLWAENGGTGAGPGSSRGAASAAAATVRRRACCLRLLALPMCSALHPSVQRPCCCCVRSGPNHHADTRARLCGVCSTYQLLQTHPAQHARDA